MERHAVQESTASLAIRGVALRTFQRLVSGLSQARLVSVGLALAIVGWSIAGLVVIDDAHQRRVAHHLAATAGLTAVRGSGVEIVLTDARSASSASSDPSAGLVQDGDLILLNLMLWYGGAQAVAINGERITAQSTIVSSGPTLLVNGRRMVGPFYITAIGDPTVLRGALETRGGALYNMRQAGLGAKITLKRALIVPAGGGQRVPPNDDVAVPTSAQRETP